MKRKVLSILFSLALLLTLGLVTAAPAAANTITVDDSGGGADHTTIQAAINAAAPGDTINVAAGTYTENVNVNKSLTLAGAGSATVTVTAASAATSVFNVTANSVNISGFTVTGANVETTAGIYLAADVTLCNIHDNILTGNGDGMWLGSGSNHNTITNNDVSSNSWQGFEVYISSYNTFEGNTANSNTSYGFKIDSGRNNQFTNNIANSNGKNGFYVVEGDGGGAVNSTFTNNTANLNTEYGIRINGGSGSTLTGNTFNANVKAGIRLKEAITGLTLNNNNISGSLIGIDIDVSVTDVTSWTGSCNNITGNSNYGISNAGTGTLKAENNWWGSASGPTDGTVIGLVDFDPWRTGECPSGGDNVGGEFDTCNAPVVTVTFANAAMNPMSEQTATVNVDMGVGAQLDDLGNVVFKVWYDSNGGATNLTEFDAAAANVQTCAVITWTKIGDAWAMLPSGTTWSLGTCITPVLTGQSGNFTLVFTPGKVATATTSSDIWQIAATATRPAPCGSGFDADNEGADMNWYGELSVATANVDWGTVLPSMDFDNAAADVSVGSITYISNGAFDKKAKTGATWGNGSVLDYTEPLCIAAQEFALKADDSEIPASGVLLNTTGAEFGSGVLTTEAGSPDSPNTLWLKLAPSFTEYTYSGTVTYIIATP